MNAYRALFSLLCLVVFPSIIRSQETGFDALHAIEERRAASLFAALKKSAAAPRPIDVNYYGIAVRIADQNGSLSGDVTMKARVLDSTLAGIAFDLSSSMTVDSVFIDGGRAAFTRSVSQLDITPPTAIVKGTLVTTRVYYHGSPSKTGLGSYTDAVSDDGARWVYTLSEPYGARDWWPCIDHPSEKADSADITITCSASLRAVSNGLFAASTTNSDGTKTYFWKHRYPIAPYLIAVTIGNFSEFSDYYTYSPTDSMPVVNYVLPTIAQTSPAYRANTALTPRMLEVFSSIFGQYPFIREKYGHVEFGWGGGMEHQTLTSLGSKAFTEGTIAHELVHQWFGDMITCRSWGDLWLNEGFAQYFESVWQERQYGQAAYFNVMRSRMAASGSGARAATGTLYVQDTANVNNLFAQSRVYNKGSWVLHMLRHTVGDSLFFAAIKTYANDPAIKYGTASTADLRRVFEQTTGRELGWFFNEWVFGERYPRYTYSLLPGVSERAVFRSSVRIQQTTGTANPAFFTMPIDLKFFARTWDTTVTVFNTSADETFQFAFSHQPDSVQLDPQQWILRDVTRSLSDVAGRGAPLSYSLSQNYPNPFNPASVITFSLPAESRVVIKLYDVMGREAATLLDAERQPGRYSVSVDGRGLSSGIYIYRMTASHGTAVFSAARKLLLLR